MEDKRKPFFNWLIKKARKDKRILLLVGDLGYNFIEEFQRELPEQFLNCGIAEQNMIGIASGLYLGGYKPFCYSGAVFVNYRCLEQVRNAWFQGINIKVVGTGASPFLGFSHNFIKGEREPLKYLKGNKRNYIRL